MWHKLVLGGLPAVLLLASAGASANLLCCHDAEGKKICGNVLPGPCYGRAHYELNQRGTVVRRVEAPLTPEQRKAREAEEQKRLEEEKRLAEERRRNAALVASYPSERDIDAAKTRALAEFDKTSQDIRRRHEEATKAKAKLEKEKEFYQKKPMPANLKAQIRENEEDLKKTQSSLDNNTTDREALVAKYDEEKKRWLELKYGKKAETPAAPSAAPSSAPAPADKRPR